MADQVRRWQPKLVHGERSAPWESADCPEPSQYYKLRRPNTAERRLCLAILEDAILAAAGRAAAHRGDLSSYRQQYRQREAESAAQWLASRDTSWPFSFENICAELQLDPDYIRKGLGNLDHYDRDKRDHRAGYGCTKVTGRRLGYAGSRSPWSPGTVV